MRPRRTQAQLCFSQGAAGRPGAAGAARGAGAMQVLREEAAGLLRRVQARDAAVRSGKRGEDGAAASAPLNPLLTACLDLFLRARMSLRPFLSFFVSFSPVALKLAGVTELLCFPLAKSRNKIVVDVW